MCVCACVWGCVLGVNMFWRVHVSVCVQDLCNNTNVAQILKVKEIIFILSGAKHTIGQCPPPLHAQCKRRNGLLRTQILPKI